MSGDATIANDGAVTVTGAATSFTVGSATADGSIVIWDDDNDKAVTLQVPNGLAADYTLTLPPDNGGDTQVLQTDGNGVLTWEDDATGSALGANLLSAGHTITTDNDIFTLASSNTTEDLILTFTGDTGTYTSSTSLNTVDFGIINVKSDQLESDIATGTAPLIVASETMVDNLNADLLDGEEAAAFEDADADLTTIAGLTATSGNVMFAAGSVWTSDASPAFAGTDITGTAVSFVSSGVTVTNDDTTDDGHEVVFTTDAETMESDGDMTYNPSTNGGTLSVVNLVASGMITGGINVVTTVGGSLSPDMDGSMYFAVVTNGTDDTTYSLPTAASGMSGCFYDFGGDTGTIILDPEAGNPIVLDGLEASTDDNVMSPGNDFGDFLCLISDGNLWYSLGRSGTWVIP
jgi:hypothetical protein